MNFVGRKILIMIEENLVDEKSCPQTSDKSGLLYGLGKLNPGTLVNTKGLADIFRCHTETIRRAIDQGYIPPPTQIAGGKYWTAGFLLKHINERLAEEFSNRAKEHKKIARLNI